MDALRLLRDLQAKAVAGDAEAAAFLPMFTAWLLDQIHERAARSSALSEGSTS